MSKETLEALEDAVRAHFSDVWKDADTDGGTRIEVTSFVLAAEGSGFSGGEDADVVYTSSYAVGSTTSPSSARGMSVWLADVIRGIGMDFVDDDDG